MDKRYFIIIFVMIFLIFMSYVIFGYVDQFGRTATKYNVYMVELVSSPNQTTEFGRVPTKYNTTILEKTN